MNKSFKLLNEPEIESISSDLCGRLIRAGGENPSGYTDVGAKVVTEFLDSHGIEHEVVDAGDRHLNVLARIGREPKIIMCGHIDVVPTGDTSKWSHDPYSGDYVDGKVRGRGASDMKAGVTSILLALADLKASGVSPRNGVLAAIVCDEEIGGAKGVLHLRSQDRIRGEFCLLAEPTGSLSRPYEINVGEKSPFWVKAKIRGKPAHGSMPLLGENAIEKATKFLNSISSIVKIRASAPRDIRQPVRNTIETYRKLSRKLGVPLHRHVDHFTLNVGTIHGGVKTNVVPDECIVELDIRVPIGQSASTAEKLIKRNLPKESEILEIERNDPSFTSPNNAYSSSLIEIASYILGAKVKPTICLGATDGRFFRGWGIPAVVLGPGYLETIHTYDEYVRATDIVDFARVYSEFLKRMA